MTYLEQIKSELAQILNCQPSDFSYPPQKNLGDLSYPCFEISKRTGENPAICATSAYNSFNAQGHEAIERAIIAGPYLNFFFKKEIVLKISHEILKQKNHYGTDKRNGNRIMIEYSNANTHKEYHIGHLRNITYGDAVAKLLLATGEKVISASFINDFGINVARTIWHYQNNRDKYQNSKEPKGHLLGQCYVEATEALENNPEGQLAVSQIMKAIEARSGKNYQLWKQTRRWSMEYFEKIYKILNVKFQKTLFENDFIDQGYLEVNKLLAKGILEKSQGAIIANLEKYNLGVLPIIRSDGTGLYPVADLALAAYKFNHYRLDESIVVVDIRQGLYFKQLFKIMELSGATKKSTHLGYDFVNLPSGMMSSRSGNVISFQDLYNQVLQKAIAESTARHPEWRKSRIEKTAKKISVAVLKFEMLKVSPEKSITFSIEEALRFDGYTAIYIQYALARISGILKKINSKNIKPLKGQDDKKELEKQLEIEKNLMIFTARFPEIVNRAAIDRDPSEITKYLFELAKAFTDYYNSVPVVNSLPEIKPARIKNLKSVRQVITNGLKILGIEAVCEM